MLKQKEYNIADSNIANIGTDLDKKVRQAAAQTEPAWTNAGRAPGLQIWRIEKFNVKSIAKETYGTFYSGDSYIVLNTYKKKGGDALAWDVHFWLGKYTTQDEAGTAAYKTVELDDLLGGAPVQHREVQEYESALFLSYFNNNIKILAGGVETGFRHVEPEKYQPRLLHIKGKKRVRVTQVEMNANSLNSGDVFVLDKGLEIYQFNGAKAGPQEKMKGAQLCRAIDDERKGMPKVTVIEENSKEMDTFWKALGSKGAIKAADVGGNDDEADKNTMKKLFRLSDQSGKMEFKECGTSTGKLKRSLLDSKDVFVLDAGQEVFAWIGKGASVSEKKYAMQYAQEYLKKFNRPAYIPISRVLEGGENEVFEASFD
jgi:gelsolin